MGNYSLRCAISLILAVVLAAMNGTLRRALASDDVRTIVQQGHYIYDYDISADGKYAVSVNKVSIALWNLEKRRIVKLISRSNDGHVRCHPLNPAVVYITTPTYELQKNRKYIGFNIFTGEETGVISGSELPKRNNFHDDYKFKLKNGCLEIRSRKTGRYLGSLDCFRNHYPYGGIAGDASDSLVVMAGQYPVIWDLRNARVSGVIPYRDHLMQDTTLVFPSNGNPPLPKSEVWKINKNDFTYGWKNYLHPMFCADGDILLGGFNGDITRWDLQGNLKGCASVAGGGPVYSFTIHGRQIVAATYSGLQAGSMNEGVSPVDGFHADNDYKALYMISRPFRDEMFATVGDNHELRFSTFDNPACFKKIFVAESSLNGLSVSPDDSRVLAHGQMGVLWEVLVDNPEKRFRFDTNVLNLSVITASLYLDNSRFVTVCKDGQVAFWTSGNDRPRRVVGCHYDSGRDVLMLHDGKRFITSDSQGGMMLWNAETEQEIAAAYTYNQGKESLIITPDNYYKATPGAFGAVHFARGMEVYPLEQFDLRYNRPDIVLERLGASKSETEPYYKAWLKRLHRMGYTEESLSGELHAPEIVLNNDRELTGTVTTSMLHLDISANDLKYNLNKFFVNLNGVPILGKNGRDLTSRKSRRYDTCVDVELCEGDNTIEIFVINAKGTESFRKTVNVEYAPPVKKDKHHYVAAIGVSEYADSRFNLEYASKDAGDIVSMLEGENVKTLLICDSDFTPASLKKISEFFAGARRDDAVTLFYAGHGLLDSDLNYYLSHYNVDFNNPSTNGIAYEDFENILDGVKSVNRLCLIDACHSGEIDKEEYVAENVASSAGTVKFRSAGVGARASKGFGAARTRTLFNEIFLDIRWGIGATIVSSAGALEVAMEGEEWKNGLFTWCMKRGISGKTADSDGDGRVSVSELGEYLVREVSRLSCGKQVPTLRARNSRNDFYIVK